MKEDLIKEIKALGFGKKDCTEEIFIAEKDNKSLNLIVRANSIVVQIINNNSFMYFGSFNYNDISQNQIINNIKYLNATL